MRLAIIGLLMIPQAALTQEPAPEAYKPLFGVLFPRPTGMNGYEEIVQAGDIAKLHAGLNKAFVDGASLTQKRRLLRDPAVMKALQLLRSGLAKERTFPAAAESSEEYFRSFAAIRQLARLLVLEQYVMLADGRVGDAIDSVRDALNLGYSIQRQMLIGGLVGIAVDAIAIRSIAEHLDQLSARDCERLTMLASDWLATPDPGVAALDAEREFTLREIRKTLPPDAALVREVLGLVSARIASVQALLKRSPWERSELPELNGSEAAMVYLRNLEPAYLQVLDRFTMDLAKIQLLGVHAAIRRYRWEHNRLPESLEALKLGRLGIDPFTGAPFLYQTSGDSSYTLKSVKVERL